MLSKITGGETTLLFTTTVLNKYEVKYFRCNDTGFIQTEEPYWLEEAYSSAITKLDIGLPYRNITLSGIAEELLLKNFNPNGKFLDYAGGYGLFTRLMRDKGFDFYNTDKFCDNIFAKDFDLDEIQNKSGFELVTAFEVLEHLTNPYEEVEMMLKYGDSLLFTTELQHEKPPVNVEDWWYFIPETGQHVAFYNEASLTYMANKLGFNFYTNGTNVHLFTKKKLVGNPFKKERDAFFVRKMRKYLKKFDSKNIQARETLLQRDWEMIKQKMN
jgi:2-polyprenyl-3-methyl-5-hydroxy-6-metoxy-1,4-benzoquinol methylase